MTNNDMKIFEAIKIAHKGTKPDPNISWYDGRLYHLNYNGMVSYNRARDHISKHKFVECILKLVRWI